MGYRSKIMSTKQCTCLAYGSDKLRTLRTSLDVFALLLHPAVKGHQLNDRWLMVAASWSMVHQIATQWVQLPSKSCQIQAPIFRPSDLQRIAGAAVSLFRIP
jgi:hypothetical protein